MADRAGNAQVEHGCRDVQHDDAGNGRLGRRQGMAAQKAAQARLEVWRQMGPHQLPAQHHPHDDGGDRQAFDPAIGLDQLRRRQKFGQDAVLGG